MHSFRLEHCWWTAGATAVATCGRGDGLLDGLVCSGPCSMQAPLLAAYVAPATSVAFTSCSRLHDSEQWIASFLSVKYPASVPYASACDLHANCRREYSPEVSSHPLLGAGLAPWSPHAGRSRDQVGTSRQGQGPGLHMQAELGTHWW